MKPSALRNAKTILEFQRLAGNQRVGNLLRKQSKRAVLPPAAAAEIWPEFSPEVEARALVVRPPKREPRVQALRISVILVLISAVCSLAVHAAVRWTSRTLADWEAVLIAALAGGLIFASVFHFAVRRTKAD